MRDTKSSTPGGVCPERSFLKLILSESKRSERSGHLCRIMLVYLTNPQGLVMPMEADFADRAICLLSRSCRDTDYVGWYRHGHIVGVLLTTLQRDSLVDGCKTLQARFAGCLGGAFAFPEARSLQMHILNPDDLTAFLASSVPPRL